MYDNYFYHFVGGVKKWIAGYSGNVLSESSVEADRKSYSDSQVQTVKDWLTGHGYTMAATDSDQTNSFHIFQVPKPH